MTLWPVGSTAGPLKTKTPSAGAGGAGAVHIEVSAREPWSFSRPGKIVASGLALAAGGFPVLDCFNLRTEGDGRCLDLFRLLGFSLFAVSA